MNGATTYRVKIYDGNGKLVKTVDCNEATISIDKETLNNKLNENDFVIFDWVVNYIEGTKETTISSRNFIYTTLAFNDFLPTRVSRHGNHALEIHSAKEISADNSWKNTFLIYSGNQNMWYDDFIKEDVFQLDEKRFFWPIPLSSVLHTNNSSEYLGTFGSNFYNGIALVPYKNNEEYMGHNAFNLYQK